MSYTASDEQLIWDIVTAGQAVTRFSEGASRKTLDDDEMRASAIIRQLEIVGEAVSKLSLKFRAAHPEIPWRDVIAMRNILIHAYRHVDLDKVWVAVSQDVPQLLALLEPLNGEPDDVPE